MSETAEQVVDLVVAQDVKATAANAIYDEIAEWCADQRRWQVRLANFLRPWRRPRAPHVPFRPLYWRCLVMIREPFRDFIVELSDDDVDENELEELPT